MKMGSTVIKTIQGDITRIDSVEAIVNAVSQFVKRHPGAMDEIVWVLFDGRTKAEYDRAVEELLQV